MTTSTITAKRNGDPQHYVEGMKRWEHKLYEYIILKTPCGVDTAAAAFGVRRVVIRFASCSGWMLEGVSVPLLICVGLRDSWRFLADSWQLFEFTSSADGGHVFAKFVSKIDVKSMKKHRK